MVGSIITLLFRASSKFRLIYCFFLVKSWFFIEKVQDVGKLGCRIAQVPLFLWNHFVNFNQALPKCSLGDPLPKLCLVCLGSKEGPKRGLKWLIIIVLIVRCFKKTVYFLFIHSYDFVTVSPLSSKTNNCYNITSVILIIYFLSSETWWYLEYRIVFILHRKIFPIHHTCMTFSICLR